MKEQRAITKRFKLDLYGKKNINDQTILALRIPYRKDALKEKKSVQKLVSGTERLFISGKPQVSNEEEDKEESKDDSAQSNIQAFNPSQENPNFYEAYGKVYKVVFLKHKMQVIVDINHRSPIDFEKQ